MDKAANVQQTARPWKRVSYVFGGLMAIASAMMVIYWTCILMAIFIQEYMTMLAINDRTLNIRQQIRQDKFNFMQKIYCSVMLLAFAAEFLACVLLIDGLRKMKSGQLICYLHYGLARNIATTCMAVACYMEDLNADGLCTKLLVVSVVYIPILYIIYKTRKNIKADLHAANAAIVAANADAAEANAVEPNAVASNAGEPAAIKPNETVATPEVAVVTLDTAAVTHDAAKVKPNATAIKAGAVTKKDAAVNVDLKK